MKIINPPKRDLNDLSGLRLALYCRVSDDAKETGKSVTDQETAGRRWSDAQGCRIVEVFRDNDRSASRFATREREDFDRLIQVITAGSLDIVWFWELSRSQRRLDVYVRLRDLCRERGVLWVVSGRVYDLNNYMDMQALGYAAVNSEVESELISDRVRRGQASSAAAGRPHGKLPYGYVRVYDSRGRYVRQDLDEELHEAIGVDETKTSYSTSGVMREVITRIANGDPLITIERSLNERGIPSPRGGTGWRRGVIRKMAMTVTYIGRRVHQGEMLEISSETWPALVSEEIFYAAQNVLNDPARATTKPARAAHLLSYLVRCGKCGKHLQFSKPARARHPMYACIDRCCAINAEELDDLVERAIVGYLSRPDVYTDLMNTTSDDARVTMARAECERLRAELEDWRRLAEQGEVTAVSFARTEKGLLTRIAEEEAKTTEIALPPVLRGRIGEAAAASWKQDDLAIKREIIRLIADIRIAPAGKGRRGVPVRERISTWRWLLGPEREKEAS
mgnify:CR=1 FL=1